jgi:hypothetical protein
MTQAAGVGGAVGALSETFRAQAQNQRRMNCSNQTLISGDTDVNRIRV